MTTRKGVMYHTSNTRKGWFMVLPDSFPHPGFFRRCLETSTRTPTEHPDSDLRVINSSLVHPVELRQVECERSVFRRLLCQHLVILMQRLDKRRSRRDLGTADVGSAAFATTLGGVRSRFARGTSTKRISTSRGRRLWCFLGD